MLAFTVENTMVANTEEGSVWTGKLRWQTPSTRTLRDVIEQTGTRTADQTAVQEAAAWLETYLVGQQGRALVAKAISLGEDAGHSRATLYKAKTRLGLQSESENTFPFRSVWVRQVVDVSVDAVSRAVEPETSTPTAAAASANYPVETPETPETTVGARRGGVVVSAPTTPETTTTETTVALDRIEALLATGARNVRETAEALTTDDLPECLADLTAPDHSDPVGQHDLEDLDPVATRGGGRGEDPASAGRLCGKVMHTSYGGNTLRCLAEADASGFCPVHRSPASVVASRRSTRTPAFKKQRLPSTGDDGDA
jgi:hypothetical protein